MSVIQAWRQADTALRRSRALFGDNPTAGSGTSQAVSLLRDAQTTTADTVTRASEFSGALPTGHQSFAERASALLGQAAGTDTALQGYLRQAAQLTRSGAGQIDALTARVAALAQAAAAAKSPGAQRAVLAQLRSLVGQAQDVVSAARQQAGDLADDTGALSYRDEPPLGGGPGDHPPKPNNVRDLGPVAGTGAHPGIRGIGAADLGEIVELPNGKKVAIFGDAFSGNDMGIGDHYRSVAVEVNGFDAQGRPIYGKVLTGPLNSGRELFSMPPEASKIPGVVDTLPAGTVKIGNKTYMMVVGTDANLKPTGGSWLTELTNDPGAGWKPIPGSWRPWEPGNPLGGAPTQLSGYQGADGKVYIAANQFDRGVNDTFHGVTMYRVDPADVTNRSAWQPWTGNGWGSPGAVPSRLIDQDMGELSFREIDGHPVLSGFNRNTGNVEVRVGGTDPTQIFNPSPTVIAQQSDPRAPNFVFHNYGGYIIPGSHLNDLRLLISKWGDGDYQVREFLANLAPPGPK